MPAKIVVDITEFYILNRLVKIYGQKHRSGIDRVSIKQMKRFHNVPGMDFCFCESKDVLLSKPSDIIYFPNVPVYPFERKKQLKQKVFFTVHDLTPLYFPQNYTKKTAHKFMNFLINLQEEDSFFCVSEFTKDKLSYLGGVNPDNITVTHLGADTKVFYPAKDTNIKQKY